MATGLAGSRGTGNAPSTNQLVVDMSEKIYLLDEEGAPFLALGSKLGKKAAKQPKVMWMEDVVGFYSDVLGAAATAAATDLTVTNFVYFKIDDLVLCPRTGEVMRVAATPTTTTMTVVRATGEKFPAQAMVLGEPIVIIGNAMTEGDGLGDFVSTKTAELYNYCQIFADPFMVTGTMDASQMLTGDDLAYQRMKKGIEHAHKLESALLFGDRAIANPTLPTARRMMGGLTFYITTKIQNCAGVILTEDLWNAWLESLFEYGSSEKVVFASNALLRALQGFGLNGLETRPGDSKLGMAITSYLSPFGTVNIVRHKQLSGATWGYAGLGVDLGSIEICPLRDTVLKKLDVESVGTDAKIEQYFSEISARIMEEKKHAELVNFTV